MPILNVIFLLSNHRQSSGLNSLIKFTGYSSSTAAREKRIGVPFAPAARMLTSKPAALYTSYAGTLASGAAAMSNTGAAAAAAVTGAGAATNTAGSQAASTQAAAGRGHNNAKGGGGGTPLSVSML